MSVRYEDTAVFKWFTSHLIELRDSSWVPDQVAPRTKLLILDVRGSTNAVKLARTLRGNGLTRAYVIQVTFSVTISLLSSTSSCNRVYVIACSMFN